MALTLWGGGLLQRTYDSRTLRVVRIEGPGLDLGHAYDAVGNVTRITDTVAGEVWAFTYDELDRLIGMGGSVAGTWTLDEGGRWLARTEGGRSWSYDYGDPSPGPYRAYLPLVASASSSVRCFVGGWAAAWSGRDAGRFWRLVEVSDGTALAYDSNGNVLSRTIPGASWRYIYDPENRLAEAWRGNTLVARYRYDPDGRRVVREVEGGRTVVVDEGYELTPAGVRKTYRLGGEIVAVREGGIVRAVVGEHLGSLRVLAEGNSVAAAARYHPYGGIRAESGLWPTDRRYTGQRWVGALGLYDYNARFYDPTLGRFLQPDTIVPDPANPQSLNRYAYVLNNPVRYTDPSGHALEDGYGILWRFTPSGELRAINLFPPGAGHSDRDLTYFAVMQAHAMANSTEVQWMEFANRTVVGRAYSYPKFYSLVADGRRWDIKDEMQFQLGKSFRLCSRYACHWYEYSVLGNILYGFTGAEAGFSEREIRLGAGYAEARDPENKDKRNWPGIWPIAYLPPEHRPYYYDNPQDYHAVGMGIEMSRRYGADVTIREFQALLVDYHEGLASGPPRQGPVPGWPYAPGDFDNR